MNIPASQTMEVLLIDDDQDDYLLTEKMLSSSRECYVHLTWASSFEEGRSLIYSKRYDAILVDYYLGVNTGLELIEDAMERKDSTPFILLTGRGSSEVDFRAMEAGAILYLTKNDLSPALLARSIKYAVERKHAEQKQLELLENLQTSMLEAERIRSELEGIFASQNDVVLIYDTEMRVRRANHFFQDNYGFDPIGLHVKEIIRGVKCRLLNGGPLVLDEQPTPRALRGEKVSSMTYLVTKADGRETAVATSSGPIQVGESITGTITVWHDIEQSRLLIAAEERNQIARELHDSVAQALFSINLFINAIYMARKKTTEEGIDEYIQELRKSTREAMFGMRLLIFQLRPHQLDEANLVSSLQNRLDAVEKRAGFKVRLETNGKFNLDSDKEIELYWIAQEALNNVLRHSEADEVKVQLNSEAGAFCMTIEDNGIGFDPISAERCGGQGLQNLQERAVKIGASCTIQSAPGQGTKVLLEMDLPVD
jgi:signal transduction histidine kinase